MPHRPLKFLFLTLAATAGLAAFCRADGEGRITLEQAYDRALKTDQSIRIAYLEVRKANLLPWSALTRVAPHLTAGTDYTKSRTNSANFGDTLLPNQTLTRRSGAGNLDLNFSQTLIDLSVFPAYRLGQLSARSAKLAQQFTVRETLFGVTTAYYEVLKQQRLVEVNTVTLGLSNEQLDLAEKRLAVGEVTRADVLRARVVVETARRTWIESKNVLELDRNTLRNILNFDPKAPLEVVEPPAYSRELPPFETLLTRAYGAREDLQVKQLAVKQDIERKNVVIGEYLPRVTAQASGGYNNTAGSSRSKQNSWSAGVGVDVPFFTGGQREIDLATAKYQIEQTKLELEQTQKTVEADVKQAWLTVRTLEGTLTALKVQVASAAQGYEDLQHQYAAGAATSVDVLSALNDLDLARKEFAVQTYQYEVALRNLEEVAGVFQERRVKEAKFR
ncbi:MAG TPA: TolC family protein [Chthoniobacteraceae bacterium]|nr:TolC family protein [Chthoniobacteraceae bacterium]